MNGEIALLDQKVEGMRASVERRFDGVESELRKLGELLRELVKIEGDIKVNDAALKRIGGEVDDHDKRLCILEIAMAASGATQKVESKNFDQRVAWIYGIIGAAITGITVYVFTHLLK